jgi:hypothetical protein
VRIKGETSAFVTDLRDEGCRVDELEEGLRIHLPEGHGPELVFATARGASVQVRRMRPGGETLEDVFLRALANGEER